MAQKETPLLVKIASQLQWIEGLFLTSLALGIVLTLMNIAAAIVMEVSLAGLAIVFFLYMYKPLEVQRDEGEKKWGFQELLVYIIVPKVIWISSSFSTLGILFYLFHFGNNGYQRLLMTGGSAIFIALLVLGYSSIAGTKHVKSAIPLLFRAIPLLVIDYLLFFK